MAALIFGGCAAPPSAWLARPARDVAAVGASVTDAVHGTAYGSCSPPYCRRVDDCVTEHEARCAARNQLKCMVNAPGPGPSEDFGNGYEQAFVDIARGGSGMVPAVAPRQYWNAAHRSATGHLAAQQWFEGYAAGADQAWAWYGNTNVVAASSQSAGAYAGPQP